MANSKKFRYFKLNSEVPERFSKESKEHFLSLNMKGGTSTMRGLPQSKNSFSNQIKGVLHTKIPLLSVIFFFLASCLWAIYQDNPREEVVILTDGPLGEPAQFGLQQCLAALDHKSFSYSQKEAALEHSTVSLVSGHPLRLG